MFIRNWYLVFFSIAVVFFQLGVKQPLASEEFTIDFQGLVEFDALMNSIHSGENPKTALLHYYQNPTPGLKLWMERNGVTPERAADVMTNRIANHPDWVEIAYGFGKKLEPFEEDLRGYFSKLQGLYPDSPVRVLPTYFLVATLYGSGSWEITGNFVTIGPFASKPGKRIQDIQPGEPISDYAYTDLDPKEIIQIAVHEIVHYYQMLEQGRPGYLSMYKNPEEDTLIARAIREGSAEFIAYLASGLTIGGKNNLEQRHGYMIANEKKLWELFKPHLDKKTSDNLGWFYGVHQDIPELPFQIGYSLGFVLVESFYEQAENKNEAIEQILGANTSEEFAKIIEAYEKKW